MTGSPAAPANTTEELTEPVQNSLREWMVRYPGTPDTDGISPADDATSSGDPSHHCSPGYDPADLPTIDFSVLAWG